jgi:hypothetical protein
MRKTFEIQKEAIPGFQFKIDPFESAPPISAEYHTVTAEIIEVGELTPSSIVFVKDLQITEVPIEYRNQARGFIYRAAAIHWSGAPIVAVIFAGENNPN